MRVGPSPAAQLPTGHCRRTIRTLLRPRLADRQHKWPGGIGEPAARVITVRDDSEGAAGGSRPDQSVGWRASSVCGSAAVMISRTARLRQCRARTGHQFRRRRGGRTRGRVLRVRTRTRLLRPPRCSPTSRGSLLRSGCAPLGRAPSVCIRWFDDGYRSGSPAHSGNPSGSEWCAFRRRRFCPGVSKLFPAAFPGFWCACVIGVRGFTRRRLRARNFYVPLAGCV